jgi:uncharacterized protein YcbX
VAELWRYPVKSMAGERLGVAELREDGITGDRVVVAVDEFGAIVSARTRPGLLAMSARLAADGTPLVDGVSWSDASVAQRVRRAAGPVEVVPLDTARRFDILPLLVATDGAIEAFGEDARRLRPNIVVGGVQGLAERTWEGRVLRIGEAMIGLHSLRHRCIVTTYDPDSLVQRLNVLRDIHRRFGGQLALNAWVIRPGLVRTGDSVKLSEANRLALQPPSAALGRMAR